MQPREKFPEIVEECSDHPELYQLVVDLESLSTRLETLAGAANALGAMTDYPETRNLCRLAYAAAFSLEAVTRQADELVRRAGEIYRQAKAGAA